MQVARLKLAKHKICWSVGGGDAKRKVAGGQVRLCVCLEVRQFILSSIDLTCNNGSAVNRRGSERCTHTVVCPHSFPSRSRSPSLLALLGSRSAAGIEIGGRADLAGRRAGWSIEIFWYFTEKDIFGVLFFFFHLIHLNDLFWPSPVDHLEPATFQGNRNTTTNDQVRKGHRALRCTLDCIAARGQQRHLKIYTFPHTKRPCQSTRRSKSRIWTTTPPRKFTPTRVRAGTSSASAWKNCGTVRILRRVHPVRSGS